MRISVILIGLALFQATYCYAQPLEDWPVLDTTTPVGREFNQLRNETRPLLRDNPAQVVELYQKFLREHPDIKAVTAVSVALTIGQVQTSRLRDPQAALETYRRAAVQYPDAPNLDSILTAQAALLQNGGKTAEAMALLANRWDTAVSRYFDDPRSATAAAAPLMQQYVRLLEVAGKREEIISRLSRAVFEVPALLDEDVQGVRQAQGWVYDALIEHLLTLKRTDEALSWAKLRFMLCDYDPVSIKRAVATLARVWRARGPAGEAALKTFLLAQEETATPAQIKANPLRAVPLPAIDGAQMALLARSSLAREAALNVRLLTRRYDEAMKVAYESLLKQGKPATVVPAIRTMARVMKATSLDVHSANAFLAAINAGEGAEQVRAFLVEHTKVGPKKPTARQQQELRTAKATEDKAQKEFAELQAGLKLVEQNQPAEAIIQYRRFNDERPNMPPAAGVLVSATVARLYANLKEFETAFAIYDWALQRYGTHPSSVRLVLDRARLWAAKDEFNIALVKVAL